MFREFLFRLARAVFFSFALALAMAIYCLSFELLTFETHLAIGAATIPIFTYFSWKNLENQVFPHASGLEGWVAVVYWIAKNSVMMLIGWPLVWVALILSPEISYFLNIPHNRRIPRIWLFILFLGLLTTATLFPISRYDRAEEYKIPLAGTRSANRQGQ